MQELFPIVSGLVLGLLLGKRPSVRSRTAVFGALILAFGILATIVSGEFRISWAFLLIDIPLVAVSAAAGYIFYQRVYRPWTRHHF